MGRQPGAERWAVVVERAFSDRNDLKASVATVLVILAGEASGLLASTGFGFVETRLKVCADGGIAVDAFTILRCGKSGRPWIGVRSDRVVRKAGRPRPPRFGVSSQNGMSSESAPGVLRSSCGSSALSSPWFGPLHRRSMRSAASVTP